jgi:GTPase SAR1 family protein
MPGEAYFKKLRRLSYSQTDVFVVMFSLVNPTSFENVALMWVPEIQKHCPNTPFILVGTRSDLRDSFAQHADEFRSQGLEAVPTSWGEAMMKIVGACAYVECSPRFLHNLKEVFETGIKIVLHPPGRFAPGLLGCVHRGDVDGVKSTVKRKEDVKCVDVNVLLFFMGILI